MYIALIGCHVIAITLWCHLFEDGVVMDNQIHIGVAGAAGNMGRMVVSELIRREQQEQGRAVGASV